MAFLSGCLLYLEIVLEGAKVRGCLGMETRLHSSGIESYAGLLPVACLPVPFPRKDIHSRENHDLVDYVGLPKLSLGVYMVDCRAFLLDGVRSCASHFIASEYLQTR